MIHFVNFFGNNLTFHVEQNKTTYL